MESNHRGPRLSATVALVLALAAAVGAASCGGNDAQSRDRTEFANGQVAAPAPDELWGREFVSTAVSEDGEPQALFAETRVKVTFKKRDGYGDVWWRARCNDWGARVAMTADRLVLGRILGTLIGCPGEREEQDEWLDRFFDSDPRWTMSDDRLTLESGEAVLELEERQR